MSRMLKGNPAARRVIDEWIVNALQASGKTLPDLAEQLGLRREHASRIGKRRRIIAEELATISEYTKQPLPQIGVQPTLLPPNVLCDVNRGDWHEQSIAQLAFGFALDRFAVRVCGHLIERDFTDNTYAICSPLRTEIRSVHDRYVLVEVESQERLYAPYVLKCIMSGAAWKLHAERHSKNQSLIRRNRDGDLVGLRGQVRKVQFLGLVVGCYHAFESHTF